MRIQIYLTLILLIAGGALAQSEAAGAEWNVTLKVVDENGQPVAGANVSVSYFGKPLPGQVIEDARDLKRQITGQTDANGEFMASHTDRSFTLGIAVEKDGYYSSHSGYDLALAQAGRNPTFTIVLKQIHNPIPMYAKWVNLGMPIFEKGVGFDLTAGVWAAPYGKGTNADIIFTGHFDRHPDGESDYTLTVSFPGAGDGIQEFDAPATVQDAPEGASDLRSSHEAPPDGYQSKWIQTDVRKRGKPVETNRDTHHSYYFRATLPDGPHYGKIYGYFMQFTYYLNPTPNDRNIEFDPRHNLLRLKRYDLKVTSP